MCPLGPLLAQSHILIGKPVIFDISSDQKLNVVTGHEKVVSTCELTSENITGAYWERVDGNLPSAHNESKLHYHNNGKTTLRLSIIRAHPAHSGRYRCVVHNQWGVIVSKNVQVTIGSK